MVRMLHIIRQCQQTPQTVADPWTQLRQILRSQMGYPGLDIMATYTEVLVRIQPAVLRADVPRLV